MSIVRVLEKSTPISLTEYQGYARLGELIVDISTNPQNPTIGVGNIDGNIIPLDRSSVSTDRLSNGSQQLVLGSDGFLTSTNDIRQGSTVSTVAPPGISTVIYTASTTMVTACKLFVYGVGAETGPDVQSNWQTQGSDAIVIAPVDRSSGAITKITVYGVVYSSVSQLFTLSSQLSYDGRIQVAVTPISTVNPVRVKVTVTEISS